MTVTSKKAAWDEVNKIFPTDYEMNAAESERAGYSIFRSTAEGVNAWISDLGDRLEVNLPDGKTVNVWIEEPKEQNEDDMAAIAALDTAESAFFSHYDPETVEWFMSLMR